MVPSGETCGLILNLPLCAISRRHKSTPRIATASASHPIGTITIFQALLSKPPRSIGSLILFVMEKFRKQNLSAIMKSAAMTKPEETIEATASNSIDSCVHVMTCHCETRLNAALYSASFAVNFATASCSGRGLANSSPSCSTVFIMRQVNKSIAEAWMAAANPVTAPDTSDCILLSLSASGLYVKRAPVATCGMMLTKTMGVVPSSI
mmetsp:Transcript_112342/g.267810  ORF Transcript_112342/g.267810 Transcript_112342/m.267810 type:complete len:208 (-) Transcript_112342:1003-1626(-)